MKKNGLCDEDIERAKRVLIGRSLRKYNSVEKIGNDFIRGFMNGFEPFEYSSIVENITKDELAARLCGHYDENLAVLSVIEPSDGGKED